MNDRRDYRFYRCQLQMRDDNFLAQDLESLKNAAREARQHHGQSQSSNQTANRTDIVHAGYRLLQCAATGIIFIYHRVANLPEKLPGAWDLTYNILFPTCFLASLILAITRIMHFIPNPNPIIPVTISVAGWLAMLGAAIMAMRHAHLELDIEMLTDDEVASDPIFRHDLLLCSLSLVGSSVYLVHAWLCYDCWQWEKREKKMREAANAAQVSSASSESESDSGMSSNSETEQNYQTNSSAPALPGTSGGQGKSLKSGHRILSGRASRLLNKLRRTPKTVNREPDPFAVLDEILRSSVVPEQIKVEDEPVRLYCCCVDLGNMIKHEYSVNAPVHEFQVVHVM